MSNASFVRFYRLVIVLSVPFYALGALGLRLPGQPTLPLSALMGFVPIVAATIFVYRAEGAVGVAGLLRGARDFRKFTGPSWYVVAVLFMPAVSILEFVTLRLTGLVIPNPQFALGETVGLFVLFFVGAIGEEVGWQRYAYPLLRTRASALKAAVVLGTLWALWHVIPFLQLGRSADWIFWHSLCAVAMRIIMVWLFENTHHSVLVAVLFHTMINVSWALFPVSGSYYNPFATFVILAIAAGLIVVLGGLRLPAPDTECAGVHATLQRLDALV